MNIRPGRTLRSLIADSCRWLLSTDAGFCRCPGRCSCVGSASLNILLAVKAGIRRVATRTLDGLVAGRKRPAYNSESPNALQ